MAITEGGNFTPNNNIVSPGVFTRENDASGLAQGISNIGAVVIAPFADGPAFYPTYITSPSQLNETFGLADGTYWGPYTAMEYLKEQGSVTVVRVGSLTGYWQKNPLIVYAEPGTWEREDDVAALKKDSTLLVNTDNIIESINYVHASEAFLIEPLTTTGAVTVDAPINYTYGPYIAGCKTTEGEINAIINNFSKELSNFVYDDGTLATYNDLIAIKTDLLKFLSDSMSGSTHTFLTSLDVKNIHLTFDSFITGSSTYCDSENTTVVKRSDSAAMTAANYKEYMSGYDVAWFAVNDFDLNLAGNKIYINGENVSGSFTNDEGTFVSINSILDHTYLADVKASVNLTKLFIALLKYSINIQKNLTDTIINFPFSFVSMGIDEADLTEDFKLTELTSYNKDSDATNDIRCVTKISTQYDTSYITKITGTVIGNFNNGTDSITDVESNKYINDYLLGTASLSLSGGTLYRDQTLEIGKIETIKPITEATYYRAKIKHTVSDALIDTSGSFFYLYTENQRDKYTAEYSLSEALKSTSTTIPTFSTSVVNQWLLGVDEPTAQNEFALTPNTVTFSVAGAVNIYDIYIKAIPSINCGYQLNVSGILRGSFGALTGLFIPNNSSYNPCNGWTSNDTKPLILAVLANTMQAESLSTTDLSVFGFSGSGIRELPSNEYPYSETVSQINPYDTNYELRLNVGGADDASETIGFYEFSLDESKNNYIKKVFGTNPLVGDTTKQVVGQKINAAYAYILFEDSIRRVKQNKVSEGWNVKVTAGDPTFNVGETLKFTDAASTQFNVEDSEFSITNAYTPWIYSQKIAPFKGSVDETAKPTKHKLFKVHTLSDGTLSNQKYKIEISNVKLAGTVSGSEWGTFTLSVRKFDDTDKNPKILESYHNLTLDPDSANFIARRIGDYYAYITFSGKIIEFGTYRNLSKYIRIEMTDIPYPVNVVPYGFQAYSSPIGGSATAFLPAVKYSKASIYGLAIGRYASGTVFNDPPEGTDDLANLYPIATSGSSVYNDTKQYFKPLPAYGSNDQNGDNIDFDLEDKICNDPGVSEFYARNNIEAITAESAILDSALSGSIPATYDSAKESTYVKMRKFVVGFQGGFDGRWPAMPINLGANITSANTQGLNCEKITSPGSIAYKQCIAAIGNADEFDINLIVAPGIFYQYHTYVATLITDTCERRGDCFYILDNIVFPQTKQSVSMIPTAVNCTETIDSSYVATYYPWVKILDTNINKIVSVAPSVIMPSVYAANDKSAAEWFAPAGLNRGGITQAIQVLDRLTHEERDVLYSNRINPIAAFPGQGIAVWGQKTLQHRESALSGINVRRLLITVKKYISSVSRYLIFEPNVAATRNRFLAIVNPYMQNIQQRHGLYSFKVIMDESINTTDLIDQKIMYGKIYLKPTRPSEKILIDFNIFATGASFDESI